MDTVFSPADILIPKCDLSKWAVIACDQYTSEPDYWERVKLAVGNSPSALNIVLPEIYLKEDNIENINAINREMEKYLNNGIFETYKNSYIYVEREQSDKRTRYEIIGKVDLKEYDYSASSTAAVRASEKTVVSRIPPRVEIRKEAPLELPHILLLAADPEYRLMDLINKAKENFKKIYDFTLMQNGGHIKAWVIDSKTADQITAALEELKQKNNGFLFCVGDGNHSLATAKECYNQNPTEKNRYALASVVNIHDKALDFEPIYRVCFGVDPNAVINAFVDYCGGEYSGEDKQRFVCCFGESTREIFVKPLHKLPVGTLQTFLDEYLADKPDAKIDYIHGEDSLITLSKANNTVGFMFCGMQKDELFTSVEKHGSLPRKTFSMGHADDKRFYIEARKIK